MDNNSLEDTSPYEIHWEDPSIPPTYLNPTNVLQYFCHLSNPFYERECNNEVVRMQGLSLDRLTSMTGIEYYLDRCQESAGLYVIRKQNRIEDNKVTPLAYYYIINGSVRQAPDLATLINSRLHAITAGLNKAFETLSSCARYNPSNGSYTWEAPSTSSNETKTKKEEMETEVEKESEQKPQSELATGNAYQVNRTEFLLKEWVNQFPAPSINIQTATAASAPGSTQPTPQPQQSQPGSSDTPGDRRTRLM